jgi:hypothetical protein
VTGVQTCALPISDGDPGCSRQDGIGRRGGGCKGSDNEGVADALITVYPSFEGRKMLVGSLPFNSRHSHRKEGE